MSKRFEFINFLNAHDEFRDNKNNKKLDSFDIVSILNHYEEVLKDLETKGAFAEIKYDYDEDENGETVEQVIVDNKKYIDIEYFAQTKAELKRLKNNLKLLNNNTIFLAPEYLTDKDIEELKRKAFVIGIDLAKDETKE